MLEMTTIASHVQNQPAEDPGVLPDFAAPPLTEVVLSLQFKPLTSLRTPHLGLLWQQFQNEFRNEFPTIEEQAPIEQAMEVFGPEQSAEVKIQLQMLDKPPVPRCWFISQDGTQLIQVQQDRFIHNWRKTGDEGEYPRYERVRERFRKEFQVFHGFLTAAGLGTPVPNQCEVTYVNHIIAGKAWQRHSELAKVLVIGAAAATDGLEPEDIRLAMRYIIRGPDAVPLGRLHVTATPGWRKSDGVPVIILNLTARGAPLRQDLEGALGFFDIGRRSAVRLFAAITTTDMHEEWGRLDATGA